MRILFVLLILFELASVTDLGAETSMSKKPDMAVCVTCHGPEGRGNKELKAPGIANLQAWYIKRQLNNYREGLRGAEASDAQGMLMRSIVESFDDESIAAYAETSAAYPDYVPDSEASGGNASLGKSFYAHQCGACHGPSGQGVESLGAPVIARLEGWYVRRQIDNFKKGVRGSEKGDRYGGQMVFYLSRLKSLEDLDDIIAYLRDPEAID